MSSSQDATDDKALQQSSHRWAEIIGQLFDRLTGKGASLTYEFDHLIIDVPRAQGPAGQELGSAKWTIDGKIVISAETHEEIEDRPISRVATSA